MNRNTIVNIPSRSISCSVDLDALIASIQPSLFNTVVYSGSINLSISYKRNRLNSARCRNAPFPKTDSVKIGVIESEIGLIDVYFITSLAIDEVFERISDIFSSPTHR